MKKHKQLSLAQRYQIESLSKAGLPQTPIAFLLGVDKSTICREVKRNTPVRGLTAGQYIGVHAQQKTDLHHSTKSKQILLSAELKKRIAELMWHQKWNPELIAKRLAKEGEPCVSHKTIYKWIWMANTLTIGIMLTTP
ncbi:MAG: IS30 family transposase [Roseivirga sp.]|jgi:IS30 family transposase